MSSGTLLALLLAVGIATFLCRYAMIGLLVGKALPPWLHAASRLIAPASFAALTASALFVQGGDIVFMLNAPKPWAALVAALVAWHTRHVLTTIAAGMAALYLFKFLF